MKVKVAITGLAVAAMVGSPAFAGGLAPTVQAPVVVVPAPAPPPERSSWGIILPILGAALLIGIATSKDNDDDGGDDKP